MLSKISEIIQNLETGEDTTTIWCGNFNLSFDVQLHADKGSPKLELNLLRTQITKNYVRQRLMRHIHVMFSLGKMLYLEMQNPFQAKKA